MIQPSVYLTRIAIFLVIVTGVVAALHEALLGIFMTNPVLNGLILGVLLIGVIYVIRQVLLLRPAVRWVESFRRNDPSLSIQTAPSMLSPLATMLQEKKGRVSLSTMSLRSLLDSISSRLDESRDISRYLIGTLVILGLLGTFWGLIDAITSAHAPAPAEDKRRPFAEATPGAVGLETLLPAALSLHHEDGLDLLDILRPLTDGPASLLGLDAGALDAGRPADLILFDPGAPVVIDADTLKSKSKNSPFDGRRLQGRVLLTIVGGRIVHDTR